MAISFSAICGGCGPWKKLVSKMGAVEFHPKLVILIPKQPASLVPAPAPVLTPAPHARPYASARARIDGRASVHAGSVVLSHSPRRRRRTCRFVASHVRTFPAPFSLALAAVVCDSSRVRPHDCCLPHRLRRALRPCLDAGGRLRRAGTQYQHFTAISGLRAGRQVARGDLRSRGENKRLRSSTERSAR